MRLLNLLAVVALVAVPALSRAAGRSRPAPAPASAPAPAAEPEPAPATTTATAPVEEAEPELAPLRSAPKGDEDPFGTPGQIVPSGFVTLGYASGSGGYSDISFAPRVLYFVIDNLAVGGTFALARQGYEAGSTTSFGLAPTAAYNIELIDELTIFPGGSLSYNLLSPSGGDSYYRITLSVFSPVLYHITSHFFLGAGPELDLDLVASDGVDKQVSFLLATTIGGYFSL